MFFGKVFIVKSTYTSTRTLESEQFPRMGKKFIRITHTYENIVKPTRVEVFGSPKSL